jgi:hypothetical protein
MFKRLCPCRAVPPDIAPRRERTIIIIDSNLADRVFVTVSDPFQTQGVQDQLF